MKKLVMISLVLVVLWLFVLRSDFSTRFKKFFTAFVIASPIPPIP